MDQFEVKVGQFISVADCSEKLARKYLDACAGDLDMAIVMLLENEVSPPQAGAHGTTSQLQDDLSPTSYKEVYGVRAPIPQTSGVLIEEGEELHRKVLRSRRLPQTVFNPFQDYSGLATRQSSKHGKDNAKRKLAELFRPPQELLFNGSFHEAKLAGQQNMCWLMVNLQDSKEFSSQLLNRDVWSDSKVKQLLLRHFLFIQVYRVNEAGIKFMQLYHIETYPNIAIIDPRTGELMMSWGCLTAEAFVREVTEFLASNPYDDDKPSGACMYKQESIINESEQSQFEAAIRASLDDINKNPLVISSDDSDTEFVSMSSYDDGDNPAKARQVLSRTIKSIEKSSQDDLKVVSAEAEQDDLMIVSPEAEQISLVEMNRKRESTRSDYEAVCSVKRSCTDIEPVCTAINNIELERSLTEDAWNLSAGMSHDRGRKSSKRGKTRIGSDATSSNTHSPAMSRSCNKTVISKETLDEQLISGRIHKDEVSQILFRLPDGSRLQKNFLSTDVVGDLVVFLEKKQGLKMSEHEVFTHFPKRSVLDMDHNSSLKQSGLYPRETVFIHQI